MPNILIDAREMLPPEPLERALTALDLLRNDDELTLILNQRPQPLLQILARNGYAWNEAEEAGGGFKYQISRS